MPIDDFPDISLDIPPLVENKAQEEALTAVKKTGFKGKALARKKANRIFHENLPDAAKFIADLLKKKPTKAAPITSEDMKLLIMQKDAAETIIAYGMGKPGTQALPKVRTDAPPPIDFNLGNINDLKKQGAPIESEDSDGGN